MHIATLFTQILQDPTNLEIGNFSVEVHIDFLQFSVSPSKQEFVKKEIATHLAQSVLDTEVPLDYWRCNIEPTFARDLNLPLSMAFK